MGTFSIWTGVIIFYIICVPLLIKISKERSKYNILNKKNYIFRFISIILAIVIFEFLKEFINHPTMYFYNIIFNVFVVFYSVNIVIKRLNDINKNKWNALLTIVPIVNLIFLLYLCFPRSQIIEINSSEEGLDNLKDEDNTIKIQELKKQRIRLFLKNGFIISIICVFLLRVPGDYFLKKGLFDVNGVDGGLMFGTIIGNLIPIVFISFIIAVISNHFKKFENSNDE